LFVARTGGPFGQAEVAGRAAAGLPAGRGLLSGPDDQPLGAQAGEVVADIGGGDLQGRGELGGGGAAVGGQVVQDALAGCYYRPIPPGPPSQEGGKYLIVGFSQGFALPKPNLPVKKKVIGCIM
jgi:hypothetical protein